MSEDRKYNGWTNYETWNVALWINNSEGDQSFWIDRAQEVWNESEPGEYDWQTRESEAVSTLAEELKNSINEAAPELGASMFSDLLNASLSEVDWHEIAESFISEVDKTAESAE